MAADAADQRSASLGGKVRLLDDPGSDPPADLAGSKRATDHDAHIGSPGHVVVHRREVSDLPVGLGLVVDR